MSTSDFLQVALKSLKVLVCDSSQPWDDIRELDELQTLIGNLRKDRIQRIGDSMSEISSQIERLIDAVEYTKVWQLIAIADEAKPEDPLISNIKLRLFNTAYEQFHQGIVFLEEGNPVAIFYLERAQLMFPTLEGVQAACTQANTLLEVKRRANGVLQAAKAIYEENPISALALIDRALSICPTHAEALAFVEKHGLGHALRCRKLSFELEAAKKALESGNYRKAAHAFLRIVQSGCYLNESLPLFQKASMLWQKQIKERSDERKSEALSAQF